MILIQNEALTATITPVGVELSSLIDRKTKLEYIWQADPEIWGSHAPVLFPIIGGLRDNKYRFDGKIYSLPKHGFVRHNHNLALEEHGEHYATFVLSAGAETREMYPFDFTFRITYHLTERSLTVSHRVDNEGNEPMYFSLGGHPAFRVPLEPGAEKYESYYLEFPTVVDWPSYTVNGEGLIGPDTREVPWTANRLPLTHELFNNDALVFKHVDQHRCSLVSERSGPRLTVHFSDFNYLGIWAKPNGDFVCIEPWLGIADAYDTDGELETKEGIVKLGGKNSFSAAYRIEIHEG